MIGMMRTYEAILQNFCSRAVMDVSTACVHLSGTTRPSQAEPDEREAVVPVMIWSRYLQHSGSASEYRLEMCTYQLAWTRCKTTRLTP